LCIYVIGVEWNPRMHCTLCISPCSYRYGGGLQAASPQIDVLLEEGWWWHGTTRSPEFAEGWAPRSTLSAPSQTSPVPDGPSQARPQGGRLFTQGPQRRHDQRQVLRNSPPPLGTPALVPPPLYSGPVLNILYPKVYAVLRRSGFPSRSLGGKHGHSASSLRSGNCLSCPGHLCLYDGNVTPRVTKTIF
jgi:hypothetical protein